MLAHPPIVPAGLARLLVEVADRSELERWVYLSTGDRLFDSYASPEDPNLRAVDRLLKALAEDGTIGSFLKQAYRDRPTATELRSEIARSFPEILPEEAFRDIEYSLQVGGLPRTGREAVLEHGPGLRSHIGPRAQMPHAGIWTERLAQLQLAVCRVELAGQSLGTGFLVGASVVLTNQHVVAVALQAGRTADLVCRFGFRARLNGTYDPGRLVKLGTEGVLDAAPPGTGEEAGTPDTPPPEPLQLDYALLHLAEPIGDERGTIALSGAPFDVPERAPLIVLQHPRQEPIRIAIDTEAVIGLAPGGHRLRYRTETEPGSSGSPCLTLQLTLVALHNFGDPARGNAAGFRQGIPIWHIADRLKAGGFDSHLARGTS